MFLAYIAILSLHTAMVLTYHAGPPNAVGSAMNQRFQHVSFLA